MTASDERDPRLVAEWVIDHATGKDPRLTGQRTERVRAMGAALRLAMMRVTASEAVNAVDKHYRQPNAEPITSDALLDQIRRTRQAAALAAQSGNRSPEVEAAGRRMADRIAAEKRGALPDGYGREWTVEQAERIRSWVCPTCEAPVTESCRNGVTGGVFRGGRTFHPARVRLAYPTGAA